MNDLFEDLLDQGHVVIYLDDILIFHDSLLTLRDLTHAVLQRLGKLISTSNLRSVPLIKPPLNTWVSLLLMAKFAWTLPKSLALPSGLSYHGQRDPGLSRLLQLLPSFYCNYSAIATPSLRLNLERHCLPMDPCTSSCVCRTYFPVYPSPVLALPDHTQPFRLITDASDFATGAILEQPDLLNRWHPVAYFPVTPACRA